MTPVWLQDFLVFGSTSYRVPSYADETVADLDGPDCRLAIVEFDDQGLCYADGAMAAVERELARLADRNPIIIAFVHGWKHNARPADSNLIAVRQLLKEVRADPMSDGRPVLGVYIAWRGLSRYGNYAWEQSSFWDRMQAAQRVAGGLPRELLGRLKAFRNGPDRAGPPRATFVVIGHSFGGLVVYTALAQSLIEAASSADKVIPSFGDLVLLVNPAFRAVSWLPVYDIVQRSDYAPEQPPVFVSVTATNDTATGTFFPLGTFPSLLEEAWRTPKEREALFHTMGHIPWMRTHELSLAAQGPAPAAAAPASYAEAPPYLAQLSGRRAAGAPPQPVRFGEVLVTRVPGHRTSPFWVASATPQVIDGHNGIFLKSFFDFVYALLASAVAKQDAAHGPGVPSCLSR
jgi:hypothetical protein